VQRVGRGPGLQHGVLLHELQRAHQLVEAVVVGQHGLRRPQRPGRAGVFGLHPAARAFHQHVRDVAGEAAQQRAVHELLGVVLQQCGQVPRDQHDAVLAAAACVEHVPQRLGGAQRERLGAVADAEGDHVLGRRQPDVRVGHAPLRLVHRLHLCAGQIVEDDVDALLLRELAGGLHDPPGAGRLALQPRSRRRARPEVQAGSTAETSRPVERAPVRAAGATAGPRGRPDEQREGARDEHQQREQAAAQLARHAHRRRASQISRPSATPPSGMSTIT
jgi:hypothetical protein